MHITLNGETIDVVETSLLDCLKSQNIDTDKKGIAIAINDAVVSRQNWSNTTLAENDAVEVVRPFQGG